MIVPEFWAEARRQERAGGRQITVRRFGWSDISFEDAQQNAEVRAGEALSRLRAGEKIRRQEPKLSYNGAAGVPIREEILGRYDEVVVTRNLYGAQCLNTPDVLFADIDFEVAPGFRMTALVTLTLLSATLLFAWLLQSGVLAIGGGLVALCLGSQVAQGWWRLTARAAGGVEQRARKRIDAFVASHPDWHLRLYRTPAGFRVLAMHRTFDPAEQAVAEFFQALGTDPVYVRMCLNQRCFRARVSPKPWRIGIAAHLRPRPGVWPINPERLPDRYQWVAHYEKRSDGYAACRFVQALGSARIDPKAAAVQTVHDELSRACLTLPIA